MIPMVATMSHSQHEASPSRRSAFTLVELLVVIAIVALLVALLLPTLGKARAAAREAVCLSNHRQLGVAWATYINDYGVFPYAPSSNVSGPSTVLPRPWGGVDWYPNPTSVNIPARDRVVNLYVGSSTHIDSRTDVFTCPLDVGVYEPGNGVNPSAYLSAVSLSPRPETESGTAGTSYLANSWMYCKPGAANGWGGFPTFANLRTNQGPQHVLVPTSHFVILQDSGPSNWMVSAQITPFLTGAWWHGKGMSVHSFLDGSARLGKAGRLVCDWYSMHMAPRDNASASWRWPDQP
jgi:prepilin-type N-terminal cleavage/methylation domain-containing protein